MEYGITILDHQEELFHNLHQLQQNGMFCDVELQCRDGIIHAHKLILVACGSPLFHKQVTNESSDTKCCISMLDYTLNTVSALILGLYTGRMKISSDKVWEMASLCQCLGLEKFELSIEEQCSEPEKTLIESESETVVSVCNEDQGEDLLDPNSLQKTDTRMDSNTIQDDYNIAENLDDLGIQNSDNHDDHIHSTSEKETNKRKQTSPIVLDFQNLKKRKDMVESDKSLSEKDLHSCTNDGIQQVEKLSSIINRALLSNSSSSFTCQVCKQPFQDNPKDPDKPVQCKNCRTQKSTDQCKTQNCADQPRTQQSEDQSMTEHAEVKEKLTKEKMTETGTKHSEDLSVTEHGEVAELITKMSADMKRGCNKEMFTLKTKDKPYDVTAYNSAYDAIVAKKMSVKAAANKYNVPAGMLTERLRQTALKKRGQKNIFEGDQAKKLEECFKILIKLGYRYTVEQFREIAMHYAVCLGKRTRDQQLAKHWFYLFIDSHPELKELREQFKSWNHYKSLMPKFFTHLSTCLSKNSLQEKPDLIYSFTALELSCKPPYIVKKETICANTGTDDTVTMLLCCNGIGDILQPYFVLPESTTGVDKLQRDCAECIFHDAEDNLYNTELFLHYLQTYFIKNAPETCKILLVDAHNLFVSVETFDWTRKNNIELVVLPADFSPLLQPIETVCNNHFEDVFNAECKLRTKSPSTTVKIEDLCKSAKAAYDRGAFTKERIKYSFGYSGIYPLKKDIEI